MKNIFAQLEDKKRNVIENITTYHIWTCFVVEYL